MEQSPLLAEDVFDDTNGKGNDKWWTQMPSSTIDYKFELVGDVLDGTNDKGNDKHYGNCKGNATQL